jgi:hypothetical protein
MLWFQTERLVTATTPLHGRSYNKRNDGLSADQHVGKVAELRVNAGQIRLSSVHLCNAVESGKHYKIQIN